MEQQGFFIEKVPFCHIDLRAGITQQLLAAGVPSNQIVHKNTCTFESPLYFSYRRDKTDNRQISLIGLIDE
jgi:copper oxidase (laccase) domain-containing protein